MDRDVSVGTFCVSEMINIRKRDGFACLQGEKQVRPVGSVKHEIVEGQILELRVL